MENIVIEFDVKNQSKVDAAKKSVEGLAGAGSNFDNLNTKIKQSSTGLDTLGGSLGNFVNKVKELPKAAAGAFSFRGLRETEQQLKGTAAGLNAVKAAANGAFSEKELTGFNRAIAQGRGLVRSFVDGVKQGYREAREAMKQTETAAEGVNDAIQKTGDNIGGGFTDKLRNVGRTIAAYFVFDTIREFATAIFNTTAQFQKFEAVLTTALGSRSEAVKSMQLIKDFAGETNFGVDELTESYVKLVNRGFKPTKDELTSLADLANSQGKSFNQLIEAVLDAQTGEMERLKEFGIIASKNGDIVSLSFKGVTKEVANTDEAIKGALLSFGKMDGVAGSTKRISETLGGMASNLQDKFGGLLLLIGTKLGGAFASAIGAASNFIDFITRSIESGSMGAFFKPIIDGVAFVIKGLRDSAVAIGDFLKSSGALKTIGEIFSGLAGAVGLVFKGIGLLISGFKELAATNSVVKAGVDFIARGFTGLLNVINTVVKAINLIPAAIAGFEAYNGAVIDNVRRQYALLVNQVESAGLRIKRAFIIGSTTNTDAAIANLKKQAAALTAGAKTPEQAAREAFNRAIAEEAAKKKAYLDGLKVKEKAEVDSAVSTEKKKAAATTNTKKSTEKTQADAVKELRKELEAIEGLQGLKRITPEQADIDKVKAYDKAFKDIFERGGNLNTPLVKQLDLELSPIAQRVVEREIHEMFSKLPKLDEVFDISEATFSKTKLIIQNIDEVFKKINDGNAKDLDGQLSGLESLFSKGLITIQAYESQRSEIKKRFADMELSNEVARLEAILSSANTEKDEKIRIEEALFAARERLRNANLENEKTALEKSTALQARALGGADKLLSGFGPARARYDEMVTNNARAAAKTQEDLDAIEIDNLNRKVDRKIAAEEFYFNAASNFINARFEKEATRLQNEEERNKELLDNKTISQEEYNNRQLALQREEAKNRRNQAIFEITIEMIKRLFQLKSQASIFLSNPATAVLAPMALAQIPQVLLESGIAIALTAAQGFKKGKIKIDGPGTETSDSIPAFLSKNESVIKAEATKKYQPALEAINEMRFEDYLLSIMPKINLPDIANPGQYSYPTIMPVPKWAKVNDSIDYEKLGAAIARHVGKIEDIPGTEFNIDKNGLTTSIKRGLQEAKILNHKYNYKG